MTTLTAERIAYDSDGSVVIPMLSTRQFQKPLTSIQRGTLNSEIEQVSGLPNAPFNGNGSSKLAFIFSRPRNIRAVYVNASQQYPNNNSNPNIGPVAVPVETSTDTTNGWDGTWTARGSAPRSTGTVRTDARSADFQLRFTANAVTGLRISWTFISADINPSHPLILLYPNATYATISNVHIYGDPTTPDGLQFWDAIRDVPVTPGLFNFGSVSKGTSATKQFRIKNITGNTAVKPMLRIDAANVTRDTSGIDTGYSALANILPKQPLQLVGPNIFPAYQIQMKQFVPQDFTGLAHFGVSDGIDAGQDYGSVTLPDLAPGAISKVLTLRRRTPIDTLGSWFTVRMSVEPAGGWA